MPPHAAESTSPPGTLPQQDTPRRALVMFMILATAVIFVALFAVLYFRWAGASEPGSLVVVLATPAFTGAEIVIEGMELPEPYRVVVGSRPGNEIPFYLDRGSYTLRVSRDEKTIYTTDFPLQHNQMLRMDLKKIEHLLPPPSTAAGAAEPPPG